MIPGARDFSLAVEMTASFAIPNECEESRFMLRISYCPLFLTRYLLDDRLRISVPKGHIRLEEFFSDNPIFPN